MPTLPTHAFTKSYADLKRLSEAQLDDFNNSHQTYINTYLRSNLLQFALDAYGSSYNFNQNGLQSVTNTLFDKQTGTKLYSGGDMSIGTVVDVAWGVVDAINAAISFTPEKAGKYAAQFVFTHTVQLNNTSEGTCEVTFRITDGTSVSPVVRSGIYAGTVAANAMRLAQVITIPYEFNWADTTPRTITLQKFVRTATNVASNQVNASGTTGEFYARIEKI